MKSLTVAALLVAPFLTGCAAVERAFPNFMSDGGVLSVFNTIDQHEIESAQLAQEKAHSAAVREYAEHLIKEHKALEVRKQTVASIMRVEPDKPDLAYALDKTYYRTLAALYNKSGPDFDRAYMDYQITLHKQAIKLTEDTRRSVNDSRLSQQLNESRPNLNKHLAIAQSIQEELSVQR